jgi:hypothetical protein
VLTPPENLRSAQLGAGTGRAGGARPISATEADLAARGYLRIEAVGSDWVLTDGRPAASGGDEPLERAPTAIPPAAAPAEGTAGWSLTVPDSACRPRWRNALLYTHSE